MFTSVFSLLFSILLISVAAFPGLAQETQMKSEKSVVPVFAEVGEDGIQRATIGSA